MALNLRNVNIANNTAVAPNAAGCPPTNDSAATFPLQMATRSQLIQPEMDSQQFEYAGNIVNPVAHNTRETAIVIDEDPHPSTCPQYVDEIIAHLLRREQTLGRENNYLATQPDVTDRMRMILVDWLVDVAIKFKVHPETYYLAVDIVDRFLANAQVTRSQLQLVGVTAMLLAAKHEEIWAPEIRECIYISANTYTAEEVITMERSIAAILNFRFTVPTSYPFMCNLLDRLGACQAIRNAALFYLDCSSLEYKVLQFLPSQVAGATCFLAMLTADAFAPIDHILFEFDNASFVPIADVLDCARILLNAAKSLALPTSRFQAVRRKFSSSRYDSIALKPLPDAVPDVVFE